jgi:hypothetical protein
MEQPEPVVAYLLAIDPTMDIAIRSYISDRLRQMREPLSSRELFRPPLDHLLWPGQSAAERNLGVRLAHEDYGYKLAEIARSTGLAASTVGRIYRSMRIIGEPSEPGPGADTELDS